MNNPVNSVDDSRSEIRYRFSGHETFPFRYTWPSKAVRHVGDLPGFFNDDEALVILGVGKNMVRSIRHWSEALGLVESPERGIFQTTVLGKALFGAGGWDPFMEAPGTLWLLHWHLVRDIENASTWTLAFTRWTALEFRKEQLLSWLWGLTSEAPNTRVTQNSLKRDVEVFLRTYTPGKSGKKRLEEDSFDCPLVELGLIQELEKGVFSFVRGPKPSLPHEIFIYGLLDYWNRRFDAQAVLSFEQIMHGVGAPGGAFKLAENELFDQLITLPKWTGLRYDDTAGIRQVYREGGAQVDAVEALERYYRGITI
jgi:hypothetical protein